MIFNNIFPKKEAKGFYPGVSGFLTNKKIEKQEYR